MVNQVVENSNQPDVRLEQNKTIMLITYGLFLLGVFMGLPTLIGVIVAYVKRKDLQGTIYYDHFSYLIRTFWVELIFSLIGFVLAFVGIGIIILALVGIWTLVRVVYGLIKVLDKKPVNPKSWLV